MPTLNELTNLIESRAGGIEWLQYMRAHQEVKGYLLLPQLKSQIKFGHPQDVRITLRNLQISYSALESTKPSFLVRKKKQSDMQLMECILQTFQVAIEEIKSNPQAHPEW